MATRRTWTPETIQAELKPIVAELGRMPKREELAARGLSGLSSAMQRHGGVAMWRERMTAALSSGEDDVAHEDIARHAYYKSLEGAGGDPVAHWLDAERELSGAAKR